LSEERSECQHEESEVMTRWRDEARREAAVEREVRHECDQCDEQLRDEAGDECEADRHAADGEDASPDCSTFDRQPCSFDGW
jgi:hypothetical protein